MTARTLLVSSLSALAIASTGCAFAQDEAGTKVSITATDDAALTGTVLAKFDAPWAMTFLPDGRSLVTEKAGGIWLLNTDGSKLAEISNAPRVTERGQGGMGDIIIHPNFAENGLVFLSYVERDADDDSYSGAVVEKASLSLTADGGALENREIIWRQAPKMTGNGHYGHRLAIAPDGNLIISSSDRQHFTPAQNMASNMGKIIRVTIDGEALSDNPFYGNGGVADTIWSLGHRNILGIAFDAQGRLRAQEMGPRHGDELNLIKPGENYGYPFVSEGDHYNGTEIPDHSEMPIFSAPAKAWVPAISPAGLMIYDGDLFSDWNGNVFIGGLSSKAVVRVTIDGDKAEEAARYEWDRRIREIEQGPDGALYVLEDTRNGAPGGRLVKLTPAD